MSKDTRKADLSMAPTPGIRDPDQAELQRGFREATWPVDLAERLEAAAGKLVYVLRECGGYADEDDIEAEWRMVHAAIDAARALGEIRERRTP